ncbi:MAG TPA: YfhO family protein [Thermoanaerobaculia bacterium]|nr:YfhO family protein [Thermoanaerobaculia bacterium]
MVAILYFTTAAALLALAHRFITPLTRGAALVLVLLPLCFTGRALLTGRIYAPVEMPYIAHPFVDHARDLGVAQPHNGRLADIAFQMIPWREATRRAIADREWPLLNRFEACGDMLAGSGQPAAYSPFTLIALVLPVALSFTYTGAITFFVAGLGAFVLARELGCSATASLFAAAGWTFSAPVALLLLWPLGFAWTLLPMMIAAAHRHSVLLLTTAFVLEILAGHPETLLHVVAISFVVALLLRPELRTIAVFAIAGAISLAITAIYLLPFFDAMHQTIEYIIRWRIFGITPLRIPPHYAREALLGDLFPWLLPERSNLPGDMVAGSVILVLAVYAVVFLRTHRTRLFASLAILAALIGAQLWPFAQTLHALPLFRQALNERIGTAVPLALSILAAFAIDRFDARRVALICAAVAAVFAIAALAIPQPVDHVRLAAELAPLVAAAAILLFGWRMAPLLFVLVLGQRVVSDGRLIPTNDPKIAYPHLKLFDAMKNVDGPFRITGKDSVLVPNTATMYGLEDVRGNTPMNLLAMIETVPLWSTMGPRQFHSVPDLTRPMVSMMNVRYALLDVSDPIPPGWRDVTYDVWTRVIENERVLARAFIPRSVRLGRTPQQEIEEMREEADFASRAWLRAGNSPEERTNGGGTVVTRRRESGLEIDVTKTGSGYVVVSEAAWDGWRAYLDGHRVATTIANHAFLAVYVPDGRHKIELRFLPQSFVAGRAITFAALALIACYSTVTLFARLRG